MKAKVIKAFKGVPDGEIYPRAFNPGDTVEGDLAKVAIENKWAEEGDGGSIIESTATVAIPEGWEQLNAADSIKLAIDLGADAAAVRVKADAQAFIKAEAEKRAAAAGQG